MSGGIEGFVVVVVVMRKIVEGEYWVDKYDANQARRRLKRKYPEGEVKVLRVREVLK